MQSLKILIVEDDLLLSEQLAERLLGFGYTITDQAANSDEALLAFRKRLPDLVMMDVDLAGSTLDGIDLAREFNTIAKVPIVFLTGMGGMDTVERAKAVQPAYYLIKPCNSLQLQAALDIALNNFMNDQEAILEHSLQFHPPSTCSLYSSDDFFFAKTDSKFVRIEIADLVYVKAESPGNYVRIVTATHNFLQSLGLKSFIEQVQHPSLIRINRSYIINQRKITAFDKGRVFVQIGNEQIEIPIGSSYRKDFPGLFPKLKSE